MKQILFIALILSLLLAGACQPLCGCSPVQPLSFTGKYILVNPKTDYTFTLTIETKPSQTNSDVYQITGLSSVNQYGADATIQPDGTVNVSSIISTKRGGTLEAMNAETSYYNSLQKATKAEIVGGNLHLRSSDTNWSLLVYNKQ